MSTVLLFALYLSTAAPDLTFWDASEFVTAAQTLGIPHPPGTPLWTLLANVSARLFSDAGPVRSVTTLSVIASGLAGGIGASIMARRIGAGAAVAAAVSAGAMMSVWSNATETEVYAVALLLSVCMLAAGERAGRADSTDDGRRRARGLLAFLAALAVPLHLSALVALPAGVVFAWHGPRPTWRDVALWGALASLALSAVAVLPLRAMHDPGLNSGNPDTMRTMIAVLRREQFAVSGLWPRTAPLWLQIGNVFQYADWQVAFGLHPQPTPSFARTPISILWTLLGIVGLRDLWRRDARTGRAMLVLLASGTLGVTLWLNMRAGPSYGVGVLPAGASHEARERDYFFVLGFWTWGLLAGAGIAALARRLAGRVANARLRTAVVTGALVFAALPVAVNARAMNRGQQPLATLPRTYARLLLDAVPKGGVLFTAGDNDSFPLWYLQQVESYRRDVTVVTVPLLPATWFRAQLADRDRVLSQAAVVAWPGLDAVLRSIAIHAARGNRPYRVSALLAARDRNRIDPSIGWALEGLVYAPSRSLPGGTVALDLITLMGARERVPPSAFEPLPPGIDGAGEQIQGLLRCTRLTSAADSLLVSLCQGA